MDLFFRNAGEEKEEYAKEYECGNNGRGATFMDEGIMNNAHLLSFDWLIFLV